MRSMATAPGRWVDACQEILRSDPALERRLHVLAYLPESTELLIECELPSLAAIPTMAGYRYVKTKGLQPEPRKQTDIRRRYELLIARYVLRALSEASN
jgi:hypothetical protein